MQKNTDSINLNRYQIILTYQKRIKKALQIQESHPKPLRKPVVGRGWKHPKFENFDKLSVWSVKWLTRVGASVMVDNELLHKSSQTRHQAYTVYKLIVSSLVVLVELQQNKYMSISRKQQAPRLLVCVYLWSIKKCCLLNCWVGHLQMSAERRADGVQNSCEPLWTTTAL